MNTQENNLISRREALQRAAVLLGGVITAPAALGILNGCNTATAGQTSFTAHQLSMLQTIGDIIIPDTDTPGATKAGAINLMQDIFFVIEDEDGRNEFINSLTNFAAQAEKDLGMPFNTAPAETQSSYIHKVHNELFSGDVDWDAPRPFIWKMKAAVINAYFATEIGMTQVLQYQVVPGYYESCITFEDAGGRVMA